MKRWVRRTLLIVCSALLGVTTVLFAGCSACECVHDWKEEVIVQATCTTEGIVKRTCKNCFTEETVSSPAAHDYEEETVTKTCYGGGYTKKECSLCGDTVISDEEPKAQCSYEKTTVEVTCTTDGYDQYTCIWCAHTYKDVTERATGHDTQNANWTAEEDQHVNGCTYLHVETAKCNTCQETVTATETFKKHSYSVSSIQHATCATAGSKTYTCSSCDDSYEEPIAVDANAHNWDNGTTEGNVTTYTCMHASAHTKKVFSAKEEIVATVPATVLAETGAVELKNAEMKLDADALASVGAQNVKLSADTADKATATAGMSAEDKAKLGDNEIFDFTMTDEADAPIDFNGKITVTVPYNLPDGEDPANIAIWYIDNNGKTQAMPATYSYINNQGYATFETEHFSYYTVVRLSAKERCEMYGHNNETRVMPATCGAQGYTVTECKRCHAMTRSNFTSALVHNYQGVVTSSSCSEMGYTTYTCSHCQDSYVANYTAKLDHTYTSSVVAPTCTADGYTTHKCSVCAESYTDTVVAKTGHSYENGSCKVCGRKDNTESNNFYFNMLESIATADTYYFEISDVKEEISMTYNNGDTEYQIMELDIARMQFGFDETGIVGKGEGAVVMEMKETGTVNQSEKLFAKAEFLFANGYMYLYAENEGIVGGGNSRQKVLLSAPQDIALRETGMDKDMIQAMIEDYADGALEIIEGIANVKDSPLNHAIQEIVEYVYAKTETATGYTFTFNPNRLKDVYTLMMENKVSDIFNMMFGENAYQSVQTWLTESVDKTIPQFETEVKTELVNWGISLDQVYAYIDDIMFPSAQYPAGGEPRPSVRDYVTQMAEVKLLDVVNMAMGESALTKDQAVEMIATYGEKLGAIKLGDLVDEYMGSGDAEDESSEEAQPSLDEIVDQAVEFLNKLPVSFTTDKTGALIDVTMSASDIDLSDIMGMMGEDYMTPGGKFSYTYKFVINGTYAGDYDHLIKETEKIAKASNFTQNVEIDNYTVYVEEDATYIVEENNYVATSPLGNETYNGVLCQKIEVYINGFYILDEDKKDVIEAFSDCHGWWKTYLPCDYAYAYAYVWVNAEGEIVGTELDAQRIEVSYTDSFMVYYNPAIGKYAREAQHNYKLVKTVAPVGCTEGYELHICTVCGEEYEKNHTGGHDYKYHYTLMEGSVTCADGVLCEYRCTKCGRVEYEYETDSHSINYEDKLVYTSPKCGKVYISYGTCACGQDTGVENYYNWRTECQIDYVGDNTYACAIDGCGFEFTVVRTSEYVYDATAKPGETCTYHQMESYTFGDGIAYFEDVSWFSHDTYSSTTTNSDGSVTETWTCRLCNTVISKTKELRDAYGRLLRTEDLLTGKGRYVVWEGCTYTNYSLDGEELDSGTSHCMEYSDAYQNACTQYVVNGWECAVCGHTTSYYEAPDYWWHNDHEYYWNGTTYECKRCGTQNATASDGWIVLEDMVEDGEFKVGYFNRHDYYWSSFSYYFDSVEITVIANYDPNNENGEYGVELQGDLIDRQVTSPIGRRESGIVTVDKDALGVALQGLEIDVETVSVVFWVPTSNGDVIGYGLTFTMDEIGMQI